MSPKSKQCKCRNCNRFFFPDYRNAKHQRYCAQPDCQRASKAASQRRWLRKPANRDHFRGTEHVQRVQAWRKAHPGYWNKKHPLTQASQNADGQHVNPKQISCNVPRPLPRTLQDVCLANDPAFIGLLSMFTGTALQEDIRLITRRLVDQGRSILGLVLPEQCNQKPCSDYDHKTSPAAGPPAANPQQL